MTCAATAALLLLAFARVTYADPEAEADRAFHEASARADVDALERLGTMRPITRWSDDAWAEAARLAVHAQDFARARRDLEQVIAIGSADDQLVRRARAELARLEGLSRWDAVAREHERLAPTVHAGGDPRPSLEALEKLARDNPTYPRASMLMVFIASGWERDGEPARALRWLHSAKGAATSSADRVHASAELVRTLIRSGDLAAAAGELDALAHEATPGVVASLRQKLARAELRRTLRWVMWGVLSALMIAAAVALRRSAGSWRGAGRRLLRPPIEVMFLLPIAAILVVIAYTGNRLVARAVLGIVGGGVITSWLSGAILDGCSRVRLSRAMGHVAFAVLAIVAATYIAVDRGQLINFVIETWRTGHELG